MRRFGALFGLLMGVAAILNGLLLIAYGERALPGGNHSRVPAINALFDILSDVAGPRAALLAQGAVWFLTGLALSIFCADVIRAFLPRRRATQDGLLRDPIADAFSTATSRLAQLKGIFLGAVVAVLVAALSLLLLNGA